MEKDKEKVSVSPESALIDRIISDGKEEALKIVSDAEKYAENIVSEAEKTAAEIIAKERAEAKRASEDVAAGKRTLSALEEKKILLRARQELVETVYLRAEQKLKKMNKEEFLAFTEKLVGEYAEAGETVIIAENSPATAEEVGELSSVKKLALKVAGGGAFGGGIILSGKTCDKDLTFAGLLESLRERTEAEIAAELF
ncbi:MAG: hypothetical protein J5836_02590 [Clostridia bacterium]|nr:hypothetical protein [Clostridia bacterium]